MSICDLPMPPIQPTENIGNSLDTINSYFQTLKIAACDNANSIDGLNSNIDGIDSRIDALSDTVPGIAKAWVKFNGTKGSDSLVDDGSTSTPNRGGSRLIKSSYNINSVFKDVSIYPHGVYIISIKPGIFTSSNIVVLGTSSEKANSNNNYTWLQPKRIQVSPDPTVESLVVVHVHSSTLDPSSFVDPDFVSVVMFSL